MAIARKPKAQSQPDAEVEALIRKGGSVARQEPSRPKKRNLTPVLLRLPPDLVEQIDARLASRLIKIPRTQWILEAIHEKLGDHDN